MKYQKLFKTLIRSRFHGMYWCAHKTATLNSIQHTVPFSDLIFQKLLGIYFDAAVVFVKNFSLLFRLALAILCWPSNQRSHKLFITLLWQHNWVLVAVYEYSCLKYHKCSYSIYIRLHLEIHYIFYFIPSCDSMSYDLVEVKRLQLYLPNKCLSVNYNIESFVSYKTAFASF